MESRTLLTAVGQVFFLILSGQAVASHPGGFSVVDLTHTINSDTVYWPGSSNFILTILDRGLTQDGYWLETNKFETAEHGGTHMDAPAHFGEGKWKVSDIPAHRLVCPGVVIDVRDKVVLDPDYRLGVSDLQAWESNYGGIPDGAVVFMHSGWAVRYPKKKLTFNTDDPTDLSTFHFPGFHPDAVDWLVKYRNISMVGVDTPSTDFGQSTTFEAHRKLADANLIGLENVNNLDKVPPSGAIIFAGPIKLSDGSGGPCRILALLSSTGTPACNCPKCESPAWLLITNYWWGFAIVLTISLYFILKMFFL